MEYLPSRNSYRRFNDQRGATLVEYCLLASLIAISLILVIQVVTGGVEDVYTDPDLANAL